MKTKTKHALTGPTGPAVCGVGQGARLFQVPAGTPIDQLATTDIDTLITCKRCRARVRKRFPLWFDVIRGFMPR